MLAVENAKDREPNYIALGRFVKGVFEVKRWKDEVSTSLANGRRILSHMIVLMNFIVLLVVSVIEYSSTTNVVFTIKLLDFNVDQAPAVRRKKVPQNVPISCGLFYVCSLVNKPPYQIPDANLDLTLCPRADTVLPTRLMCGCRFEQRPCQMSDAAGTI